VVWILPVPAQGFFTAPARRASGILATDLRSNGAGYDLNKIAAGGSEEPFRPGLPATDVLMRMQNGQAVFQQAVEMMSGCSPSVLEGVGSADRLSGISCRIRPMHA
jgi:3-oxoacyl-[acyl-carrier-protein] synthase III